MDASERSNEANSVKPHLPNCKAEPTYAVVKCSPFKLMIIGYLERANRTVARTICPPPPPLAASRSHPLSFNCPPLATQLVSKPTSSRKPEELLGSICHPGSHMLSASAFLSYETHLDLLPATSQHWISISLFKST